MGLRTGDGSSGCQDEGGEEDSATSEGLVAFPKASNYGIVCLALIALSKQWAGNDQDCLYLNLC